MTTETGLIDAKGIAVTEITKTNLEYWNDPNVESMYDKHLLQLEIDVIVKCIPFNAEILDVGCGEGEGTVQYANVSKSVHAVDFSPTRLAKCEERLQAAGVRSKVQLDTVDMLGDEHPTCNCSSRDIFLLRQYDTIICQRFLINLPSWEAQQQVLIDLSLMLKPGGSLVLLEGSVQGAKELDRLRETMGLEPIPVRWHNVFLNDQDLHLFMNQIGLTWHKTKTFGTYFALTRALAPAANPNHQWDCEFNRNAASKEVEYLVNSGDLCSRLKMWVFTK
jgi:SAM-dependent methyltransferase